MNVSLDAYATGFIMPRSKCISGVSCLTHKTPPHDVGSRPNLVSVVNKCDQTL